ncbi:RHE_PE00001 family protein [Neoaquamicrobium sediminum]|uniref:RHE_PE00001 family protein n=1 Tax=Neoaquamicrobium sediminum TaxID=1849104 RepID=UPI0028AE1CC6|nr:RHE_PE00001 family protein [Mesorhizobium sediminum]
MVSWNGQQQFRPSAGDRNGRLTPHRFWCSPDWDEADRLTQWKRVLADVADLPPTLGAALIWEAWESLEPMQRQHWLGSQFASAYLRARGKVASHLFGFNVGLKAVPRERRRSANRQTRILAFLDAMSASAESGMKEISRLAQAREQMTRRLHGRRSSSSLPSTIELVLSRPIVSAPMIARAAKITQRGALNLIGELGVRELTGRRRYRAWGIL